MKSLTKMVKTMAIYLKDAEYAVKPNERGVHVVWTKKLSISKNSVIFIGAYDDACGQGPVPISVTANIVYNDIQQQSGSGVLFYKKVERKKAVGTLEVLKKQIKIEEVLNA